MSLFAKPNAAPSPRSVFGGAASSSQPARSVFGAPTPGAVDPKSVFGAARQPASPSAAAPVKSLFGGGSAQSAAPKSLFGKPVTQNQSKPKPLFGGASQQGQVSTAQPTRLLFCKPSTGQANQSGAGSLFGKSQQTGAGVTPQSIFGQAAAAQSTADPNPARSLFSSAAKSQQQSLFSGSTQPSDTVTSQQTNQQPQRGGSLFARKSSQTQQPAQQTTQQTSTVFGKTKTLFGKSTAPSTDNIEFVFSALNDLTLDEKQAYEAAEFELGRVPVKPPPRELCV